MIHELKCWPLYFESIVDGTKTFEIRRNDRGFHAGDILLLREWSPVSLYTGRATCRRITYLLGSCVGITGLEPGHVIMSIVPAENGP